MSSRETLDYVLREMTQPEGGFYSTQDADSEGEEGKFFVWTAAEIEEHLGAEQARIFGTCYDVAPGGNWEGKTILNLPRPLAESAKMLEMEEDELRSSPRGMPGETLRGPRESHSSRPGRESPHLLERADDHRDGDGGPGFG